MIQIKINTEVKLKEMHHIDDYAAFIVHTKDGHDFLHLITDEGVVFCRDDSFELSRNHETIEEFIDYYYTNPAWTRIYNDFDSFQLQFTEDKTASFKTVLF